MKTLFFLLIFTISAFATEYKVIYNLQTGSEKKFTGAILEGIPKLKEHYESQGDTLDVVVIISNKAYKFFIKDLENSSDIDMDGVKEMQHRVAIKIQKLSLESVRFEICSVGMTKHAITEEILYGYVHPAFNRTASLIEWQGKGYSLIDVL